MKIVLLRESFAICRLDPDREIPNWVTGPFTSISRSKDELSIVCSQQCVPTHTMCEADWRCLTLEGPIPFEQIGIVAKFTRALADQNVGVFVVSTFDTDYLLVKTHQLDIALEALITAGYTISAI